MIDIKQEPYLPLSFRIGGYIIIIFGLLRIVSTIAVNFNLMAVLLGAALILIGSILITTHYRLEINLTNKTYTQHTWLLSVKLGSPENFDFVDKIYVNQVKESTGYSSHGGKRYESKDILYKAFMKMDDGEKVHIDSDKNEEELNKRVNKIIALLGDLYKPE
jgi:hypothetical protein